MKSSQELSHIAGAVRRDIVRMVHAVQSGHPGGSLGCADFLTALYFRVMQHNPTAFSMDGGGEDLFFLSNGHISPVFYSVLARAGYFPMEELKTFRKIDSRLQGHPTTHEGLPGVRVASGSLGQGMSVACGAALAKRLNKDDRYIYSLHGDGELQEGQNWEAAMFAAHHKLDQMIATIDVNGQQIDGPTEQVMGIQPLREKFEAFGWTVLEMNGNEMDEVVATLESARDTHCGQGKPVCILMTTVMGRGVKFMEGTHEWHGIAPSDAQLAEAMELLPLTDPDY